jgi:hypothetical protein
VTRRFLVRLGSAAFALAAVSCGRRTEPMVSAFAFKYVQPDRSIVYDRSVRVSDNDAFSRVPEVSINGEQLPFVEWNAISAGYVSGAEFATGIPAELKVAHARGDARAQINLPGDFVMTGPDSNYVLNRDSSLVVSWRRAPGASWYWLNTYIDYDYYDINHEFESYEFDQDTIVFDTFCRYVRNRFFPARVVDIVEGEGESYVWAMDGPLWEPGARGNLTGNGYGFFSSANQPRVTGYVVVHPPAAGCGRDQGRRLERTRMERRERLVNMVREMEER